MKLTGRDTLAGVFAVFGAVVFFAKMQSYSWWLIGSWKGAVGVIAVVGLAIMVTSVMELVKLPDVATAFEALLWLGAATAVVASLFATTTKAQFVTSAVGIGAAWLVQFARHTWDTIHNPGQHYLPAR